MRTFANAFYFPLLFLVLFFMSTSLFSWTDNYGTDAPANSSVELDLDATFTLLYGGLGSSLRGDMNATGDSILTTTVNSTYNAFITSDYTLSDTTFNTHTDPRKRNSSEASLDLPSYVEAKHISFAGLFWQGGLHENLGVGLTTTQVDAAVTGWNQVTLKTPDGNYHSLTASLTTKDTTSKAYHYAFKDDDSYRWNYSAYVDVTDLVKNTYTDINKTFTVGHILTTTGKDFSDRYYFNHEPNPDGLWPVTNLVMGYYGGWSLIVVYSLDQETALAHPEEKLKTVSIYDGYENFAIWETIDPLLVSINISDFLTPKSGTINSKLLIFGGEADYGIDGDVLEIYNPNTFSYDTISNALNPIGAQFNSSYTNLGTAMSTKTFRNGVDLDIFDVSSSMANGQTSTTINFGVKQLGGSADQIFPQVIAFSTELYEPQFCYDYAYKQQGIYFTEENNSSKDPELIGDVITGEDIEMKLFIRNLVDSDISVTDMTVNITDINTTQATYITDSTKLAKIGNITPINLVDSTDLNVSTDVNGDYIRGIYVGEMGANDHFYVYYSLDPKQSTLDMPIAVEATYNLVIDANTTIPYTLTIGANIDMCSSGNFSYAPANGIFNVVHNNYYDLDIGGSSPYYNLPTQVTSREGNFKVISLDANNTDTLNPASTIVAIEMIDASAFHDTNASCQEQASSISEKIWVMFDNNSTSTIFDQTALTNAIGLNNTITTSAEFYSVAKQNTAFRISYNVSNDNNEDLVKVEELNGEYKILNFAEIVQVVGACAQPVIYPLNANNNGIATQAAQACGNSGNFISAAHLQACMECIYGFNTKLVCSRDNFAIRPEAFLMHVDDQNQTDSINPLTPQERLTTNFSGITGATSSVINIAADYKYNLEINATNHLNNISSQGYTKSFNASTPNDTSEYTWEPRTITTTNANSFCNDDTNKPVDIRFLNGSVEINSSVNQVGEYRLNIADTTWTAVDSDATYMSHHTGLYFLSGLDCIPGSTTQNVNSSILNGCNINSTHTNNEASLVYNDYDITFHPYKFNINSEITMGLTNRDINATDPFSSFVYMSDISTVADENMSVHLNSTIIPQGYNGSSLSNYVTGCYAKPIDVNVSKTAPRNTALTYRYVIRDLNTTGNISASIPNITTQDANITTTNAFFSKAMNGVLNSVTNLNFHRNQNVVANPEDINFTAITVTDPRNSFNADLLTNKTADGNVTLNQAVTHYFGRTAARKTRVICDTFPCSSGTNDEPDVLIYYEAYCYGNTNGNNCIRALLPDLGGRYIQKVDSRWYVNLNHTENGDGNLTATSQVGPSVVSVPTISNLNTYTKNSTHTYDGTLGLPYEANMQSTVPNWIVYDENNATATTNKHIVIFQPETKWTGKHETNTTTETQKVRRVNRRTMW
ncbi:MAG: hypothetical protein PF437_09395 [Sulfurimonas sp.]|jgi:hypothetical protein|nr:hypothetical protein [Sulfurimonas sp.]